MRNAFIITPISILALAVIFFALRPDSPAAEPEERVFDVRISDGEMSPKEIEVHEGDRVRLRIESEEAAEVHIHGYDLERNVEPGEAAELSFVADITGRFDIEDHLAHGEGHGDSDGHSHSHGVGSLTVLPR